jgi:hypothetical protein
VAGARWPIEESFRIPGSHLGRLAPTYHTQPKKGGQRTGQPHQQEDRTDQPSEPETTGPAIHGRLVALTLAETRRLLNLIHHGEHAVARGLEDRTRGDMISLVRIGSNRHAGI